MVANSPHRLWDLLEEDANGCWLWTRACFKNGYGTMKVDNKQWRTHRLAWTLAYGPIPAGLRALHKCDVRRCCNPDHLFIGTDSENQADMTRKGRGRLGERNGATSLTEDDVRRIREMRAKGQGSKPIAREFGIHKETVLRIARRKRWSHVQ